MRDEVRLIVQNAVEEAVAPFLRVMQELNREAARRSSPDIATRLGSARPPSVPVTITQSPEAGLPSVAAVAPVAAGVTSATPAPSAVHDSQLPVPAPVPPATVS